MIERRDDRGAHALLDAERGLRHFGHARELFGAAGVAHHALRRPVVPDEYGTDPCTGRGGPS